MVSLYRAWAAWRGLGGGPDALVQAGGVRFAAHARLLAAHSGYFKSALARPWAPFPGEPEPEADYSAAGGPAPEESVLYVPNISAQQFWPLLAYMYTGFLELTPENIYQVLLAAHLLHMPRALELCRGFLAGGAPLPAPPTTVVKPIASRKLPAFLAAAPYRPPLPEPPAAFLRARHETPFRPVEPAAARISGPGAGEERTDDRAAEAEDAPRLSAEGSPGGAAPPTKTAVNLTKNRKTKSTAKRNTTTKKPEPAKSAPEEPAAVKAKPQPQPDDRVVVDVACCDGPVRFHRVLNSAFEPDGSEARGAASDSADSDDSYVEVEEDSRSRSDAPYDNCNAFSKSLQKQMTENIRAKRDENRPDAAAGEEPPRPEAGQDAVYTCVYCNHAFKSRYCYQKHARRHINPVSIDAAAGGGGGSPDAAAGCCKARRLGPRREVRLLDMNVQYYPCKTCGCKFPSYYFVHKHRKLCHAEEPEPDGEPGESGAPGAPPAARSTAGQAAKPIRPPTE